MSIIRPLLIWLLLLGQCYGQQPTTLIIIEPAFKYYFDSVNGNNSNNGTSLATPFKDFTATYSLSSSDAVCLVRYSYWRAEFSILSSDQNQVIECGPPGPAPIIDGSDIIANASFTQDGSFSNVYCTGTISFPEAAGGMWSNVSETGGPGDSLTGTFLSNQTSKAALAAVMGGYWINGMTVSSMPSSAAVCITTTDGTSPIINGYVYAIGQRGGLIMSSRNGHVVGIETRNAANNASGFALDGDGYAYTIVGVIARNGAKHNLLTSGGSVLIGSLIIDGFYPPSGGADAAVVYHDNIGSHLPLWATWNVFQNDQATLGAGGLGAITSHSTLDNPGDLGPLNFSNNWLIAKNGAILSGPNPSAITNIVGNSNVGSQVIQAYAPQANLTVYNDQYATDYNGTSLLQPSSGITLALYNSKWCSSHLTQGMIRAAVSSLTLVLQSNLFYVKTPSPNNVATAFMNGTSVSITSNNNDFGTSVATGYYAYDHAGASGGTFSGNNNIYEAATVNPTWVLNNTVYSSLAAWKAAVSPQDAAATTSGGAASSACTLPTIPVVN